VSAEVLGNGLGARTEVGVVQLIGRQRGCITRPASRSNLLLDEAMAAPKSPAPLQLVAGVLSVARHRLRAAAASSAWWCWL
jgi:hypothetical protein